MSVLHLLLELFLHNFLNDLWVQGLGTLKLGYFTRQLSKGFDHLDSFLLLFQFLVELVDCNEVGGDLFDREEHLNDDVHVAEVARVLQSKDAWKLVQLFLLTRVMHDRARVFVFLGSFRDDNISYLLSMVYSCDSLCEALLVLSSVLRCVNSFII